MDFARKQLEKYGWTDGKGLGKHENGISQPIKPKLKRSVTGVGHDPAKDFTEHWWTHLYDKAAGNVQVKEKNGKTKKIKTKDKSFKITNSTWDLQKPKQDADTDSKEYSDYFVKTAVLTNEGVRVERVHKSEPNDDEKKTVIKITDEELFAACEGRTAHKGARHGLRALGKLARIERQEQMLLTQPQYDGYTHAEKIKKEKLSVKDLQVVEDMNINSDSSTDIKKKKKKRKHCLNTKNITAITESKKDLEECHTEPLPEEKELESKDKRNKKSKNSRRKSLQNKEIELAGSADSLPDETENPDGDIAAQNKDISVKTTSKSKRSHDELVNMDIITENVSKSHKKKLKNSTTVIEMEFAVDKSCLDKVKKNKKKARS